MNIAGLNLCKILMQNLRHRGTRDVCTFLWESAVGKITARMLRIRQVHIGDDIYDAAVGFFRETLVLAAVAGFHVENRNVKTFRADD